WQRWAEGRNPFGIFSSLPAHDTFKRRIANARRDKELSSFPCALAPWRRYVPFENPNGIPALSPAVARNELPWVIVQSKNHQPNGVATCIVASEPQPRWGSFQFLIRHPA